MYGSGSKLNYASLRPRRGWKSVSRTSSPNWSTGSIFQRPVKEKPWTWRTAMRGCC